MRIAFLRYGKSGAELDRAGAILEVMRHLRVLIDAASHNQRYLAFCQLQIAEYLMGFSQYPIKFKFGIVDIVDARRAEVAARVGRMLDHDGVRQAVLFFDPLLQDDGDAAAIGQDRNQRDVRKSRGNLGQVQRQARAHDDASAPDSQAWRT